jgi:hypothetical protein
MAAVEHNTADEGDIVDKPALQPSPVIACGSTVSPKLTSTTTVSNEPTSSDTEVSTAKSNLRPQAPEFLPEDHNTRTHQGDTETERSSMITATSAAASIDTAPVSLTTVPTNPTMTDKITAQEQPKQNKESKATRRENFSEDDEIRKMVTSHNRGSFSTIANSPAASTAAMVPDMAYPGDTKTVYRSITPATPPPIASPRITAHGEEEELSHGNASLSPLVKGEDSSSIDADLEIMKLHQLGKPMPIKSSSPDTGAMMYQPRSVLPTKYVLSDEQNIRYPATRHGMYCDSESNNSLSCLT